jgi:GNAT superfamily N-acetyltransferase
MKVIHTQPHHIPQVLNLYKEASLFLHAQGIDQWQNQYPNENSLKEDMAKEGSYVLVDDNDVVLGTMACLFEDDPYYFIIEEGSWSFDSPYGVVHRLCVNSSVKHQGIASQLLKAALTMCKTHRMNGCRIDTHPKNILMQGLITKHGFRMCGKVYVANHALRLGYERRLHEQD